MGSFLQLHRLYRADTTYTVKNQSTDLSMFQLRINLTQCSKIDIIKFLEKNQYEIT